MPIYDFKCEDCGHEEEIYFKQSANDVVDPPCSKCKSEKNVRQMSGFMPEVPNGKMYLGKRDWKNNLTTTQKAEVYMGSRDPY